MKDITTKQGMLTIIAIQAPKSFFRVLVLLVNYLTLYFVWTNEFKGFLSPDLSQTSLLATRKFCYYLVSILATDDDVITVDNRATRIKDDVIMTTLL